MRSRFALAVRSFAVLSTFTLLAAADEPAAPSPASPPVAAKIPHPRELHGRTLTDDYFWLRERDNPKVIEHLRAENAYTQSQTARLKDFQQKLYDEMLGRIQQTDLSVPYRENGYFYFSRTEEGKAYPIYCRKKSALVTPEMKSALGMPEEIMLDINAMAEGRPTLFVRPLGVSPDNAILAYGEDTTGARIITVHFKDLATGKLLPDVIENTSGSFEWYNDSKTFLFTTVDSAVRSDKAFKSRLGANHAAAELLARETDERFNLGLGKSLSHQYLFIDSGSTNTSEVSFVSADQPAAAFRMVEPRRQGVEYSVTQHGDSLYIRHNDGAVNFTLVQAPIANPGKPNWKTVLPHRDDTYLTDMTAFKDHMVIASRQNGLPTLRVRAFADGAEHTITFPEDSYSVALSNNAEFDTPTLRFTYASFITPQSTFDYNMKTRERTLLKEQPVLGGYDRSRYTTTRLYAKAADGAEVPVAVVHLKGLKLDGSNPAFLYAYGSYGANSDIGFSSNIVSMLDRGVVYALAQIRGGSEKGRLWYENGRMMNKKNTFTDFISAAETLVSKGYTKPERLAIRGGSAGGLLMGVVTNMRPDLFHAVVADVPFVDLINTMLDESLPLTVTEFEQWGNPKEKAAFDYMITYSPYDNVAQKPYPAILATTGLHDTQVSYWEPTKWVQRLRESSTSGRPILLKINMDAAHGGASGRYDRLREESFRYAWALDQLGIRD